MSRVNKLKHVMNEAMWDDHSLPKENQSIVKIVKTRGNNLLEVTTASEEVYLVSMPTKFRNNIWVKRGDYIVVEPIPEGQKVKAEVVKIMTKQSIKYYRQNNVWPKEFEDEKKEISTDENGLFVNTNRQPVENYYSTDSEDEDSSDSKSDSDGKRK